MAELDEEAERSSLGEKVTTIYGIAPKEGK